MVNFEFQTCEESRRGRERCYRSKTNLPHITEPMANSRRRKKQVEASRRQLEKNRRKLSQKDAEDKENQAESVLRQSEAGLEGRGDGQPAKSWWDWCASGVSQVLLSSLRPVLSYIEKL